jgi:hypothetical protein
VAPLVAPAVDLSILGLLLVIRQLALACAAPAQLRPAGQLLIFASTVTLALNLADPIVAGEYGKAAFDAVGPLLMIGWAEVGPDLLRALTTAGRLDEARSDDAKRMDASLANEATPVEQTLSDSPDAAATKPDSDPFEEQSDHSTSGAVDDDLLERARAADARHWDQHRRPISADTLRRKLHIGSARSRLRVAAIRADPHKQPTLDEWQPRARASGASRPGQIQIASVRENDHGKQSHESSLLVAARSTAAARSVTVFESGLTME